MVVLFGVDLSEGFSSRLFIIFIRKGILIESRLMKSKLYFLYLVVL